VNKDSAKSIQYLSRAIEVGHEMGLVWEPAVYLTVLGFEEAKGGSLKQGREHIVEGESLLRIRNRWYELGLALCLRGELELLAKDLAAARKAGLEVATLIKRHPTSPDSELRKRFRDLNRKL
jgi:hypothetical protein